MQRQSLPDSYHFGPFKLSAQDRTLWKAEKVVDLTAKEYDFLYALVRRIGTPVDKYALLQEIWPENPHIGENNVFQQIRALRRKLGKDEFDQDYIRNVPNQGYFVPGVFVMPQVPITEDAGPVSSGHESPSSPWDNLLSSRYGVLLLLVLLLVFGIAAEDGAYGLAILVSCIACLVAASLYVRSTDSAISRGALALLLVAVMAYIPSAATLSEVVGSVVNGTTIKPAVVYPFVTGLKFLPLFVVALAFWVLLAHGNDAGFRRRTDLRSAYILSGPIVVLLTGFCIARGSGDDQIWTQGLPGSRRIFAGYLVVLVLNFAIWIIGYREFNKENVTAFRNLFASGAVAYLPLALAAFLIDAQYNSINIHYLDKRRTTAYLAANPGALREFRNTRDVGQTEVGPDLRNLLNDPTFEQTLRTQRFYKQDFDELFQFGGPSLMFGFRDTRTLPDGTPNFVIVRFPQKMAVALRFEAVPRP